MRSWLYIGFVFTYLTLPGHASALTGLGIPFTKHDSGYEMNIEAGVLRVKNEGTWEIHTHSGEIIRQHISGVQTRATESGQLSIVIGSDSTKWTRQSLYQSLHFGEVVPGIQAKLTASRRSAELILEVAPGAKPKSFSVQTNRKLAVDSNGALKLDTNISLTPPIAWQTINGERRQVDVRYRVDGQVYGFDLGSYDSSHTLYIDPVIATTYVGSNADFSERIVGIAHSPSRNRIYVAGYLPDTDAFQGVTFDPTIAADKLFISAFDADLRTLIGGIIFGGSRFNFAHDLAFDEASGELYVVGNTLSDDWPAVDGTLQPELNAGDSRSIDGFIAVVDADLTEVTRATYFGGFCVNEGGLEDIIYDAALHTNGDLYIGGITCTRDLPMRSGGAFEDPPGDPDTGYSFISRITPDLTAVVQTTYFGGSSREEVLDLLIANDGGLYVAGETRSNDFEGVAGGAINTTTIGQNGFVALFSEALDDLTSATYLGGNTGVGVLSQSVSAIAEFGEDIFAVGETSTNDFPGTSNGAQETYPLCSSPNCAAGYVARLSSDLSELKQATYLGGTDGDRLLAIATNDEMIFVGGSTSSTDIPGTMNGIQADNQGIADGYLARLNHELTAIEQSTYFGTPGRDTIDHLLIDSSENRLWAAGITTADDTGRLPGALEGANDTGVFGEDGYVTLLDLTLSNQVSPPDTTPEPFIFVDIEDAATATEVRSNIIQIFGIDSATDVSVIGGSYSINGGDLTIEPGQINNGDTIELVITTPSANAATVEVILTIGGVSDTWSVTTISAGPQILIDKRVELVRPDGLKPEIVPTLGAIGEVVRYSISATNASAMTATGIVLIDVLPTELSFISSGDAAYDPIDGQLSISMLAPEETQSFTIDALTQLQPDGTKVTNTAELGSVDAPFSADVEASASFDVVDQVDLATTVTMGFDPLSADNVQIVVTTRNEGPGNARDTVMVISIFEEDALPEDVTITTSDGVFNRNLCEVDAGDSGIGVTCIADTERLFRPGTEDSITIGLADASGNIAFSETTPGVRARVSTASIDTNEANDSVQDEFVRPAENFSTNTQCFIATAAFGTPFTRELDTLRHFRDHQLLTHKPGRWLVKQYYQYSPPVADYIAERDSLRFIVRSLLKPIVYVIAQPVIATLWLLVGIGLLATYRCQMREDHGYDAC